MPGNSYKYLFEEKPLNFRGISADYLLLLIFLMLEGKIRALVATVTYRDECLRL